MCEEKGKIRAARKNIPHLDSLPVEKQIEVVAGMIRDEYSATYKYDGARLNIKFDKEGFVMVRTARSDWILESGKFLAFAQEHGRGIERAQQYEALLETIFKGLKNVKLSQLKEEFIDREFHCEFFFRPMCKVNGEGTTRTYIQNKAPRVMDDGVQLIMIVFDVEGRDDIYEASQWLDSLFTDGDSDSWSVRVWGAGPTSLWPEKLKGILANLVAFGNDRGEYESLANSVVLPEMATGTEGIVLTHKETRKKYKIILEQFRVKKT